MKDTRCMFKAGSKLKLRKETVTSVSKNSLNFFLNQDLLIFLPTYETFLPITKQAMSKRLMHMQSVCNVLIMPVTYFSLSVTALHCFF